MRALRVSIVLHERDARAERVPYIVWYVATAWRARGLEVAVERGTGGDASADVAVNHLDLTVVPEPYRAYFARFPVVVNGRCLDISKRRVSGALLGPGDAWDGPVIVKTDANCGGIGEERLGRTSLLRRVARAADAALAAVRGRRARDRAWWRALRRLPSEGYPIFPSPSSVPEGVLENPALVVERFLPERVGDLYALRTYTHLGERTVSRRVLSREPVVKASGIVRREDVEPPAEVLAVARRFGNDYGKVDYVLHEGRVVVLDVNRTPTFGPRMDEAGRAHSGERLAPGLDELLARPIHERGEPATSDRRTQQTEPGEGLSAALQDPFPPSSQPRARGTTTSRVEGHGEEE